jgi:hypothetical protein
MSIAVHVDVGHAKLLDVAIVEGRLRGEKLSGSVV